MDLGEYLLYLKSKGFHFQDDALGFIYFGKKYTNASDILVKTAIEVTLKTQKSFDGSFYVSLLEIFKENNLSTKREALKFVKEHLNLAVE